MHLAPPFSFRPSFMPMDGDTWPNTVNRFKNLIFVDNQDYITLLIVLLQLKMQINVFTSVYCFSFQFVYISVIHYVVKTFIFISFIHFKLYYICVCMIQLQASFFSVNVSFCVWTTIDHHFGSIVTLWDVFCS